MKIFPRIVQSALLVTTPALMVYPTSGFGGNALERARQYAIRQPIQIPDLRTLSYDEVIELLSLIESDSFDERCSMDELDQINQFISGLAMEGVCEAEKNDMALATASLFRKDDFQNALFKGSGFSIATASYVQGGQDILLCKSWIQKRWAETKSFVKKHKTAIIIGAIVVVAIVVVVVAAVAISASAAAGTAVAAGLATAGGAAGTPGGNNGEQDYSEPNPPSTDESLTSSIVDQVTTFKETIAREQFAAVSEFSGISVEENGRIIGSLFSHKTVEALSVSAAGNPSIANGLKDLGFNSEYPIPQWHKNYGENSSAAPHYSADLAFATDYTTSYARDLSDLNATTYQVRGDLALSTQCYQQALQDFGSAISLNPSNPVLYLERGVANFELGNYEDSIADYSQYVERKGEPFSVTDFSLGFAKGVPKGVYESGKGALFFVCEFAAHPVQTSKQVVDSISQLVTLVKNDEFGVVAEALSPELYQLVTDWDTLPSHTRGELAGYAVGKLGADLLAPGAMAKVVSKSVNSARELVSICKNIKIAQETLILETASGIGMPARASEVLTMLKKTTDLGEDLGFSTQHMAELHKAGKLEKSVTSASRQLGAEGRASHAHFKEAQEFLKQYKGFMPESRVKELIQQTGIKTFPKPSGIPENFRVQLSKKGAGMIYVHPTRSDTSVRVMPGKPHSPLPYQQKPYVNHTKNGNDLDKFGNIVEGDSLAAHIPYEEFIYRE